MVKLSAGYLSHLKFVALSFAVAAIEYAIRGQFSPEGAALAMALATTSDLASFDQTSTEMLDMQDVLSAVLLADNFLLGKISQGDAAFETVKKWPERLLNNPTVQQLTTDTTLDDSDTSLVLAADQGLLVKVGALLKGTAAGITEVMQVTAISTDTLTVTRGFGSTSGQAHADPAAAAGTYFRIISQPKQEGDANTNDRAKARTTDANHCQIFKYEVSVTGTTQAVKQAGVAPGGELSLQLGDRTLELQRELGATVYHGIESADGSDTVYRSMGGIREFLTQTDGNIDDDGGELNDVRLNALYRMAWDDGGDPGLLAGPAQQITRFSSLQKDQIRLDASDARRGAYVQKFLTDLGREVELLVDRWMSVDEVALMDMSRIQRHDLRSWRMEPIAKTGDKEQAFVLYEGTISVKNAKQAHAIATGLTVPA